MLVGQYYVTDWLVEEQSVLHHTRSEDARQHCLILTAYCRKQMTAKWHNMTKTAGMVPYLPECHVLTLDFFQISYSH